MTQNGWDERERASEAIGRELYHEWPVAMVRETTGRARGDGGGAR